MFLDHTQRRRTVGLRSWVRIPPGAWIFVCCECRVLSGRGLCDELITRPEESYRLCCVVVCDLETSRMGAPYIYDISHLRVSIEFYGADSHFCHSAYVKWSGVELWSAHVPARLSNFCCRTHSVRRDVRVERSSDVTSCFQKWRKCLLEKCANGPFYMTPSYQIIEISIWEPTYGEG